MKTLIALALASTAVVAAPADAATYLFTISGNVATFQLPSSPVPAVSNKGRFQVNGVAGTYSSGTPTANISFFLANNPGGQSGGLELDVPGGSFFFAGSGAQLFSGTIDAPTFLTGTYDLTNIDPFGKSRTLVISELTGAVPEPATWGMMILGLGMVGGSLRYRTRKTRVAYA